MLTLGSESTASRRPPSVAAAQARFRSILLVTIADIIRSDAESQARAAPQAARPASAAPAAPASVLETTP